MSAKALTWRKRDPYIMAEPVHSLSLAIGKLREQHGAPPSLPTTDPFEQVLWENVAYLAPYARRLEAFTQLKAAIGTTPAAILAASRTALESVTAHGILKADFAAKLRECARIAIDEFAGNLNAALSGSRDDAIRALRRFPGIGEPGAEKILLLAGLHSLLAADSNALRVLARLGLIEQEKSYARMYASSRSMAAELPQDVAAMQEAHWLLQQHGQTLCKRSAPQCHACPLAGGCRYAMTVPH